MDLTADGELRLKVERCDVVIRASGAAFRAHTHILCDCSPYFRALFSSNLNYGKRKVYEIPGICSDVMQSIIEYAYTGTAMINPGNVENLFIAADYLNILHLVQLCAEFLISQLCPENCIGIYKFTEHYHCPELHRKAHDYILLNFQKVMKTSDEFLDLSAQDLKGLLEKDELSIKGVV